MSPILTPAASETHRHPPRTTDRWAVPQTVWRNLFGGARQEIGILAYSALFLAEDRGILGILTDRAKAGVTVRILLGDPEGHEVAARGVDEGIGAEIMAARVPLRAGPTQPPRRTIERSDQAYVCVGLAACEVCQVYVDVPYLGDIHSTTGTRLTTLIRDEADCGSWS